mgnify:CR=1 FL=1
MVVEPLIIGLLLLAGLMHASWNALLKADRSDRLTTFGVIMITGSAMGLAARGAIPFPSTFAAFLTRAADFVRMAAISNVNVKLAGSHAGVSIGEDGPSQMALEDLAMMRAQPNIAVLYPCDAVSTERLVERMAYTPGPAYMRTSRPKTPVIYGPDETFEIGGLKVIRSSASGKSARPW